VHQWYALLLSYVGRAHEAAVHTGHASQLDPLSVQINNMYGMMLYYDGDLQGALRQYDRTVVAEPDSAWVRQNPWVLSNFARVAAMAGRHEQALHLASRAVEVVPRHPRALFDLAAVYAIDGDAKQAMAVFARADSTHPHYAFYRAWLHAMLGELDEAYVWLDKIDEWALPSLVALNNDPTLATLRADPRFERVRKKLSLPIMRDH
jgi:tetratricopeptide (TPR) repeat protein